jgi:predicted alpha/beta hydrolase family esterase
MKTAFLLHGTGGSDTDYYWFGDIKQYLESKGYTVWWPLLPHTEKPNLYETTEYLLHNAPALDGETVIIGHSSACPVIAHYLQFQDYDKIIDKAILVSGFYKPLDDEGESALMLPKIPFAFDQVKMHAKEIVLINSDNDPWGCDDKQAIRVAEKLGARFILAPGQGHMGSTTFNQPYREFPLLKKLL